MSWLQGPITITAILLVVSGISKLRSPESTRRALRSLQLPANLTVTRALAVLEIAIGGFAVLVGTRVAVLLVAISYLAFSGFVLVAKLGVGQVSTCGCFGGAETPPTLAHLVFTLLASAVALAAVAQPVGPLLDHLSGQPALGLPFVLFTGCCAWFAWAALTVLPKTTAFLRSG